MSEAGGSASAKTPASPPSLAGPQVQLEDVLASLPSLRVEDSWHDDVLRAAIRSHIRTRRAKWAAALSAVLVSSGAAALWHAAAAVEPDLQVHVAHKQVTRSGNEPSLGDDLVVTARASSSSDLRVYHEGVTLLARCPDDPRCISLGGSRTEHRLELSLTRPGAYDVILVVRGDQTFSGATMDEFLRDVLTANARFVSKHLYVQ